MGQEFGLDRQAGVVPLSERFAEMGGVAESLHVNFCEDQLRAADASESLDDMEQRLEPLAGAGCGGFERGWMGTGMDVRVIGGGHRLGGWSY